MSERESVKESILRQSYQEGKCRIWDGPLSKGTPVTRVKGFKNLIAVRRLVLLDRGPPEKNRLASCLCGNMLCVSEEHVRPLTRKRLQQITAKFNDYHKSQARAARIAVAARRRRRLDDTTAESVKLDPRPIRAIAKELGVPFSLVQGIKAGITYKTSANNPWAGLLRL